MRSVCAVITNRASYARCASVLKAIQAHPDLRLSVVGAGAAVLPRYSGEIPRDTTAYTLVEGSTPGAMCRSTALALIELSGAIERERPDWVMTIADRYETIATAIAASYQNVRVCHIQGGETSGSIDESVRHAVTKLSHLHCCATERAADFLVRMGEREVYRTGCPSLDLLTDLPAGLPDLSRTGVGPALDPDQPYLIVAQHPVTTEHESARDHADITLDAVLGVGMQALWFWPNVDAGSEAFNKRLREAHEAGKPIRLLRHVPAEDFGRLLRGASCIVGNSSAGIREAGFLGVPAVNIGTRQADRERAGNVVDVPHEAPLIANAIDEQIAHGCLYRSDLYGDGRAGERIAELLTISWPSVQKRITYVD